MLKWLVVWLGLPLAIVLAVTLGAASFWVSVPPKEHQYCLQAAKESGQKEPDCPLQETILSRALEDPVAFFTLCLVYFTGLLAVVGIGQGLLSSEQIQLAREESAIRNRPRMRVRFVEGPEPLDGNKWTFRIYLANVGDGIATIKATTVELSEDNGGSTKIIPIEDFPREDRKIEVGAGMMVNAIPKEFGIFEAAWTKSALIRGRVVYEDGRGNSRITSFARERDPESKYWARSEDYAPDEYED